MNKRPFLTVLTLILSLAGVAVAQQPPPPGYEPAPGNQQQQGYPQQQQGYPQQPQVYAQPPAYAPPPGYTPPPPGYAPPPEPAPDAGRFGSAMQLVISNDISVWVGSTSYTMPGIGGVGGDTTDTVTTFSLQPAVDLFVARNFSIGGQVYLGGSSFDGGSSAFFGAMPRLGFNIPIGSKVSIWPRLAAGYIFTSSSATGSTESATGYSFQIQAFAPVLFHPVPHFFLGIGPLLSSELVNKFEDVDQTRTSEFGVLSTIGGYLGGR